MSPPTVIVHRDADLLANATAARLITRLVDVQAAQGTASIALTGGRVGIATLRAVAASPANAAVNWRAVDVWWGDERFLPAGDPERNETQAREALLDHVSVDPGRVHVMGADEGPFSGDPEAAATAYAADLDGAKLDIVLLGVGPDGHVASLFPGQPALKDERLAVTVRDSPKPPPTRISLSMPVIRSADEVWLVVAGADKASAVESALTDDRLPAARAQGSRSTLWLLDKAAASGLPLSPSLP